MVVSQEVLKTFTPFDNLAEEYLARVQGKVKRRNFQKGTMIFKRGKQLQQSFYLLNGNIDLIDAAYGVKSIGENSDERRFPLSESHPSQVSAIAKTPVEILAVERDFLDLVMAWSQSSDFSVTELKDQRADVDELGEGGSDGEGDWMSCLLQSPLFTKIPPANIQQLFVHFKPLPVSAGQHIIREGELGDYFYVVKQGLAQVCEKSGGVVATLKTGDYFGEEALIGDTTRNATVTMANDGILMRLDKDTFKSLLHKPVVRHISFEQISGDDFAGKPCLTVDVRLPVEYRHHHLPESINAPLSSLRTRLSSFDTDSVMVVTDDGGRRSEVAAHLLCQAGFETFILRDAGQHYLV